MVKRHSAMGFLGGAHVFPGGAVEERDRDAGIDSYLSGLDASDAATVLSLDDVDRARGLYVAAVRELFEEAGILLACRAGGEWVELERPGGSSGAILEQRARLAGGEGSVAELLAAYGLRLPLDRLAYFAHWVTPPQEKKRFDTRFFLVEAPAAQSAEHDRCESVEGEWLAPSRALEKYRAHEIGMVPPTIASLESLALHDSPAAAIEAARGATVVEIRPKLSATGESVSLLYPGDSDYDSGIAGDPQQAGRVNRLVLRDGLWWRP